MALKNKEGNYFRITDYEYSPLLSETHIMLEVYSSEEHRQSGDTNFLKHYELSINLKESLSFVLMNHSYDSELSEDNNFKVAIYNHIKTLDEYKDFEDC